MKQGSDMSQAGAPPGAGADPRAMSMRCAAELVCERCAGVRLRAAEASDEIPLGFFFDALLRKDYFLRRGQLQAMLREGRHQVWIAEIGGVLVGAAVVTAGVRLVNLLVHPAYRGLHIGTALLEASAVREVRVKCDMSTGDPRGFYAARGFEPVREKGAERRGRRGMIEVWQRRGAASHGDAATERRADAAREVVQQTQEE